MGHAERCPVCNGTGEVSEDYGYSGIKKKKCHGCAGKGWVIVPDNTTYKVNNM